MMIPLEYLVYIYLIYGVLLQIVGWDLLVELVKKAGENNGLSTRLVSLVAVVVLIISILFWPAFILLGRTKRNSKRMKNLQEGKDIDDGLD